LNAKVAGAFLLGVLLTAGIFIYVIPYLTPHTTTPPLTYSQTLQFKVGVADVYNETFYSGNVAGAQLNIYDLSWALKETLTISSGVFTSGLYYESGTQLRYKFSITSWQTTTGVLAMPYYADPSQPLSGYHTLGTIGIAKNPTTVCTFSVNGAYNNSAQIIYDVSTSGNVATITLEFYNTRDESRLFNYRDNTYQYNPLVLIENYYYNATAAPLKVKIQGVECVRVETASTSGLYIALPGEDSLNRNKNQAQGTLITNNRITISFSVDVSQVTSGLGFLRFTLYDSVDPTYFRLYGAPQTGYETLQSCAVWNLAFKP